MQFTKQKGKINKTTNKMSETKVLTPNNVNTEANSTTNGEVQTGMLILVTPKPTTTTIKKINTIPIAVNHAFTICIANG